MCFYRPALLGICAALVLAYPLSGSPRRTTTHTEPTEEAKGTAAATSAPGTLPTPVMTRRIITKVDGVVVDERDSAQGEIPLLPNDRMEPSNPFAQTPAPQTPREPDGVVYGEVIYSDDTADVSLENESSTVDVEVNESLPEVAEEEPSGGLFDNFFNPTRTADANGMRFGKRRGAFIGPEGSSETVYAPMIVPEPPEESPFIAPSRNLIVGEIVQVDQAHGIAVAWMQTRFITLERNVITRNHELETTAVLRPTNFRNGRAYGLDIAVGQPMVGDEVVLSDAGPAHRRQDDLSVNVSVRVEPSATN